MNVRSGTYPRLEHVKGASLRQASALPANIRLSQKGFPGSNILAYYKKLSITVVKSFLTVDGLVDIEEVVNKMTLGNIN